VKEIYMTYFKGHRGQVEVKLRSNWGKIAENGKKTHYFMFILSQMNDITNCDS
jgi:hypothetical protein